MAAWILPPLGRGHLIGTNVPGAVGEYRWEREGRIIRCPWHGWEFDVATGESVFNPLAIGVETFPVRVEEAGDPAAVLPDEPRLATFPVTVTDGMVVVTV